VGRQQQWRLELSNWWWWLWTWAVQTWWGSSVQTVECWCPECRCPSRTGWQFFREESCQRTTLDTASLALAGPCVGFVMQPCCQKLLPLQVRAKTPLKQHFISSSALVSCMTNNKNTVMHQQAYQAQIYESLMSFFEALMLLLKQIFVKAGFISY